MWNLRLSGDLGMAAACGCVGFGCPCGTPGGHMAPLTWTERAEVRMDQEMLDRVAAVTTAEGTLANRMGIKILSASGTEVVATMPVAGNVQPYGRLPGVHVPAHLPDQGPGTRTRGRRRRSAARAGQLKLSARGLSLLLPPGAAGR